MNLKALYDIYIMGCMDLYLYLGFSGVDFDHVAAVDEEKRIMEELKNLYYHHIYYNIYFSLYVILLDQYPFIATCLQF